jgi:hypothetical protein
MSLLFTSSDFEGPYPRLRVIKGSVLYMDLRVLNPEVPIPPDYEIDGAAWSRRFLGVLRHGVLP